MDYINAIGRRKAAVARVYLSEGSGKIVINKREIEQYFPSSILQYIVKQPLLKLDVAAKYDIKINLRGGGFKGQSEAARLAIARALVKINPDDKPALRSEGFITRDPRVVERKKPGRPKARKRFQFGSNSFLFESALPVWIANSNHYKERKRKCQEFLLINYWKPVLTSDTSRESGIRLWLRISLWSATIFILSTCTKQLLK